MAGEYILHAANVEVDRWNQRGIGLAVITIAFLMHGLTLKWGLWLQNFLGVVKLLVVILIVVAGWAALGGALKVEKPDNFSNAFEGTTGSAYGVVMALYNVIWSYIGYSNANYALSETKNPIRTLKIAAPLALGTVAVLYLLANVSFFPSLERMQLRSVLILFRLPTSLRFQKMKFFLPAAFSRPRSSATSSVPAPNGPSPSSSPSPPLATC